MSLNSSTYIRILSKGLEANLPGIEDGKLRFTTDTGRLFLDSGENRVEISDFVKGKTAQEIIQIEHPLPKFYLASDTNILYYFNNNTDQWNTVKVDIGLATTASEGLMPALEDNTSKFLRSDGTWADAGNTKHLEIERNTYEALSDEEKRNNKFYMVKDKIKDPTLPAHIGYYFKIDNSRLDPSVTSSEPRWCFNSTDALYMYRKYGIYDSNFSVPTGGPGWGPNTNYLITSNMPLDNCYLITTYAYHGLTARGMIFIPKYIIDNGIGCLTRNGFYSKEDFQYYYIEFWGAWDDESSYSSIGTYTFTAGLSAIHPEGGYCPTDRISFCNIPYLVGYDFVTGGQTMQDSLDAYLADRSYSDFPNFYQANYLLFNGAMREYDGTLMLNDIDYTGRIDTSKYALKSELSGYASTADLAGKQDVLTAGTGISINGSTISATGGGGSTVSITPTLATGTKIADYSINGSTGELYAPNGGGGGSSVTPNPAGTPAADLDTIGIDGIIYNIPGSGGGSGSGSASVDLLFETDTLSALPLNTPFNYLVDTDFFEYDLVSIMLYTPGDTTNGYVLSPATFHPESIKKLDGSGYYMIDCTGYSARWTAFTFDSHTFTITGAQANGEDASRIMYPYKIYGVKFGNGSSGSSAEVIPIEAGDNTTSRTFTFENTPKFIKVYYQDTTLDGGWTLDSEIVWGQEYVNYKAHNMTVSVTGLTGGLSSISYGSDGKSMTITSGNAFGSYNSTNGSGFMFVDYGTGGESPYIETILWSGSETPIGSTTYVANLNDSIQNYDMLEIEGINDDGYYMNTILPVSYINFGQNYIESGSANSGFFYSPTSNVKITFGTYASAHPTTYTTIKGIKFGTNNNSESISEYTETDLFVNPSSSNPVSISLSDSIQNYDELAFIVTRNAYGNTYKLQYRYITSTLAVNDQIQVWCWGPNNEYISYVLTDWDELGSMAQGNALLLTKIVGIKHGDKNKLAPLIYSEEEREVGVWIDNKPLYQKTYVKNNIILTDNNWTNGVLGTSGIYITDFKAYFGLENTSNSNFPYSYYRNNSEFFTSIIDTSHEDINVRPNMNAGVNVTTGTITIWYTKNSDVPGSGSYNTFGELMHHYSTEEKVVGTWVDGNTLYEKSYTNFSSLTGQSRTLDFQLSGIDKIWYVSDGCLISNGTYPFPYIHYDTVNAVGGFWDLSIAGSPKFEFRTGSQSTGAVINVFTIRYTKTTS